MNTAAATTREGAQTEAGHTPIRLQQSLVVRAKSGDITALESIFRQFVPQDEKIVWIGYLGKMGLLFGRHSMACLTDKRIADISLGWFGEVIYQDALLEYYNSTVLFQPSRLLLYLLFVLLALVPAVAMAYPDNLALNLLRPLPLWILAPGGLIALLLSIEFVIRVYYAFSKCGIVLWIKDGVSIYMFCDRGKTVRVNGLLRCMRDARDRRVQQLGHLG